MFFVNWCNSKQFKIFKIFTYGVTSFSKFFSWIEKTSFKNKKAVTWEFLDELSYYNRGTPRLTYSICLIHDFLSHKQSHLKTKWIKKI